MSSSGEESCWSTGHPQHDEYSQCRPKMKKEQKRRPKPKDGTHLFCGVCGDKALGYNFDAVTCESCKAFFRRNALKAKSFTCSFDGNCKLDPHTRKFCSGCRLKKCFTIGMKKNWILSDDQLATRRKRRRLKDPCQGQSSESETHTSVESPSGSSAEVSTSCLSDNHSFLQRCESSSSSTMSPGQEVDTTVFSPKQEPNDADAYPLPLSEHLRQCIADIEKKYTSIFDAPYEDVQAMRLEKAPKSANDLFNMTDMFIRRLIKFSKLLPEFKSLPQVDQIHLLKGGIMEIFVLRSAMGFDKQQQMWKYKISGGMTSKMNPALIKDTLGSDMYTNHVKFVKSFHELTGSNRITMMLLFIIELFSPDRPNVSNKAAVCEARDVYCQWLLAHLQSITSVREARMVHPKLLMKLADVRNLGAFSSQIASQLDVSKLEPLLVEVFNLSS